ncbi:NUDIX domain-containing protein [Paenibacillus sp. MBLB4367]|uniref:NUDIX domain-containing protein n=1 Tax=Paenibacillus sp. MBLB4367 TaxID=3384767 RepID=UPI0039082100
MFKLRLMATAVLFHENDLLMMKRSPNRTLSPGMWAGIGGHLEQHEIGDPRAACLREIEEETGLSAGDIPHLKLQYVLIRLNGNEIRQQFVYIGQTNRRDVGTTDEGELHWIPRERIFGREIPFVFRELLNHYLTNGPSDHVWIATASLQDTENEAGPKRQPAMIWTPMLDPLT